MEKSLKNTKKPMGLSTKIFIALIAGAISGVLIHYFMHAGYIRDSVIVEGVLYVIGQGFILPYADACSSTCILLTYMRKYGYR